MALPRKRPVDVIPVQNGEEPCFLMRDQEGIIEQPIVVTFIAGLVWDLLDGERDAADIQEQIARLAKGVKVPTDVIASIVKQLDEIFLLDTDRLTERRKEIAREFAQARVRPARFSGPTGYPDKPDALSKELEGYFSGEYGAGLPDARSDGQIRGVIAPHIDFHRGGPCYTHAYRRLAEAAPADIYIVLAVAHASPGSPFIPTTKSYETPLGLATVDRDFTQALLKRTKKAGLEDEATHRTEHSAEFQAVFLKYARRNGPDFAVVPILCSAFDQLCGDGSPSTEAAIEDYIGALDETIRTCGRKVCVVAGVDFAHVGPRFGDREPVGKPLIDRMMEGDKKSMARIAGCDAEGFWGSVMEEGNWRKVCGLSATYTTLRLLAGSQGELLRYTYAPDPAGGIVSFAAAAFR